MGQALSGRAFFDLSENIDELHHVGLGEDAFHSKRVKVGERRLIEQARVHHATGRQIRSSIDPRFAPRELLLARLKASSLLRLVIEDLYPGRVALVSSFGADAAALLHMVSRIDKATPVIFVDTGQHFPRRSPIAMSFAPGSA